MNENTQKLIEAYGWLPIESKNPYMVSFQKEESRDRLNYYFTTGTLTIDERSTGKCNVFRNVADDSEVEEILIKFK